MKTLSEKQQRFLDVLFDEAGGDVVRAKELEGIPLITLLLKSLKQLKKK